MELWQIDLRNPALLSPDSQSWLDEEERARRDRRRSAQDAQRFAAAHVGLRAVLALHVGKRPGDIVFTKDEWSRPRLTGGPIFSFSHSGDMALLALDGAGVLGIDLEQAGHATDGLAEAGIFSPAESKRSAGRAPEGWELLRVWVRKEASVKALGRGLMHPLSQVVVPFGAIAPGRTGRVLVDVDGRRFLWRLYDLPLSGRVVAALVTDRIVAPDALSPRAFP